VIHAAKDYVIGVFSVVHGTYIECNWERKHEVTVLSINDWWKGYLICGAKISPLVEVEYKRLVKGK